MADADAEAAHQWYDVKSALMEEMLGKQHDMVMHAFIPYAIGGGLDLYYYPNAVRARPSPPKSFPSFREKAPRTTSTSGTS